MQPEHLPTMGHDILLLVLGWLFGLLGPIIVWLVKNRRKADSIKAGIKNELRELEHRMVLAAYSYNIDFGGFDRVFLEWVNVHLSAYEGINDPTNLAAAVPKILEYSDEQILLYVESQRNPKKGKSVKYARLPFTEAQLSDLHLFRASEQSLLFEVLEHTKIFNETADEAKDYFAKTFDPSVTGANREIVESNLTEKYAQLGQRARIVADKTRRFLNECCI